MMKEQNSTGSIQKKSKKVVEKLNILMQEDEESPPPPQLVLTLQNDSDDFEDDNSDRREKLEAEEYITDNILTYWNITDKQSALGILKTRNKVFSKNVWKLEKKKNNDKCDAITNYY